MEHDATADFRADLDSEGDNDTAPDDELLAGKPTGLGIKDGLSNT